MFLPWHSTSSEDPDMTPETAPGASILLILRTLLQFILPTSSPPQTCEPVHRDANLAGTYYLYCVHTPADEIEVISVSHFIPDAKDPQ
jgi:hypothetical protein